jgi:hypothetical protein
MSQTLTPQPFRIPIGYLDDDGKSVIVSSEWFTYLTQELFVRAGGTIGSSTTDLSVSQFDDAGIPELSAEMAAIHAEFRVIPQHLHEPTTILQGDEVSELRARVDVLEAELKGIKQGLSA